MGIAAEKDRLLKRLISLWREVPSNDKTSKKYKEYVKFRTIYYRDYLDMHPADDDFDRLISQEAAARRERKFKEKYGKEFMEEKERFQERLNSLWKELSVSARDHIIDISTRRYRKYAKLRRIYYDKYLSRLPLPGINSDFDRWVMKEEQERINKKRDKNMKPVEELPSAFPWGDEPEKPEDRFDRPLQPWD